MDVRGPQGAGAARGGCADGRVRAPRGTGSERPGGGGQPIRMTRTLGTEQWIGIALMIALGVVGILHRVL